jgi:hypothetical protein
MGGLGRAGAGLGIINGGLSGAALQKSTKKAAEMSVRGCINSNVCKIPITKLLKMAILHLTLLLLELWLLLCGKLLNTLLYILGWKT